MGGMSSMVSCWVTAMASRFDGLNDVSFVQARMRWLM